jgi:hypothetical protein
MPNDEHLILLRRGVGLNGAQFLNCAQLVVTRNWQSAFRDEALACGASIPHQKA